MKVKDLLNESASSGAYHMFDTLTVKQLGMLRKLENDEVDPFEMDKKDHATIETLQDLGLADSAMGVSPLGQKILGIWTKARTPDMKDAKNKGASLRALGGRNAPEPEDMDVDVGDDELAMDDGSDSDEDELNVMGTPAPRTNRNRDEDNEYRWS